MRQQYQWLSEVAEFGSVPPSLLSLGGICAVSYTTRSLSLPSSPASFPSWLVLGCKDDLQYHPAFCFPWASLSSGPPAQFSFVHAGDLVCFVCACCRCCWWKGNLQTHGVGGCSRSRNLLAVWSPTLSWRCAQWQGGARVYPGVSSHVPQHITMQELSCCRAGSKGECSMHLGFCSHRHLCLEGLERNACLSEVSKFSLTTSYHWRKGEIQF